MCSSMGSCLITTVLAVCSGLGERRSLDELLGALVRFYYIEEQKNEKTNGSHQAEESVVPSLKCYTYPFPFLAAAAVNL